MKTFRSFLVSFTLLATLCGAAISAKTASLDTAQIGLGGSLNEEEGVFKVTVPRSDVPGGRLRMPPFRFWLKLGFISFGGPTGQIAIMQTELVEKKKWISPSRFLHALNFCMLLPGPEAQQLVLGPVNRIVCFFEHGFPSAIDLFENAEGIGRPAVRLRVKVMMIKEAENVRHQGADAAKTARADDLAGNFAKEAFDQVEPGRGGWCKVQMKAGMTFEPAEDLGMFVSGVVVADDK